MKIRMISSRFKMLSPVVVEPSAVAGDDDVVGLLAHVVLAGVHQAIHFGFALLFVILQVRTEGGGSAGRRRDLFNGVRRNLSPFQTARSRPPYHLKHKRKTVSLKKEPDPTTVKRDSNQGHTPRSATFPPFTGVFSLSFFEFARIKREKDVKLLVHFMWPRAHRR